MKLYDLSHRLNNESPVYPGMEKPLFKPAATIDRDGYRETRMCFESHLGTHIDAPAHMLKQGKTLDELPLEAFSGRAVVLPVQAGTDSIGQEFIESFRQEISGADFILFRTGWCDLWGTSGYFEGFPVLSGEAVQLLLSFQLKGIGFDVLSADPVESTTWDNHMAILDKGLVIIENLFLQKELSEVSGYFTCFPIPYEHADGSPVRAVLGV